MTVMLMMMMMIVTVIVRALTLLVTPRVSTRTLWLVSSDTLWLITTRISVRILSKTTWSGDPDSKPITRLNSSYTKWSLRIKRRVDLLIDTVQNGRRSGRNLGGPGSHLAKDIKRLNRSKSRLLGKHRLSLFCPVRLLVSSLVMVMTFFARVFVVSS
uniref:(northern house mosquito) hypothetical protein n=1 Tax=Culex pipiens TaxID=7175 RepID=A0A8D8KSS4_CULPI